MIGYESDNKSIVASILEAAVNGVTESYLMSGDSRSKHRRASRPKGNEHAREEIKMQLELLVKGGFLKEMSDRDRAFVAYRTTQKGLSTLALNSAMRNGASPNSAVVPSVVEA